MPSASPPHASEIEQQLKEHGTKLRHPPTVVAELLKLLEIIEQLLIMVDQVPSRSMQEALIPCMEGLISVDILKHPDMDVKVSVTFCISEITRITAPDPPYSDEEMKKIFQLTLSAFENLPHASGHRYKKLVSILDTVSRVKCCMMMLDLELDDLIIQMFKQFLEIVGSSHSRTVFLAMETIMTDIINESDDISLGLLTAVLERVKKEEQDVSPVSFKLGEKVITSCSSKLKLHLREAVKCMGTALDDYAQIVASTCEYRLDVPKKNSINVSLEHSLQPEPDNVCCRDSDQSLHGASKSLASPGGALVDCNNTTANDVSLKELEHPSDQSKALEEQGVVENKNLKANEEMKLEIVPHSVPKKRGRKPKSLKKPEEGYDQSLVIAEKDAKKLNKRKSSDLEIVNMVLGLPAVTLKQNRETNDMELTPGNIQKEGTSVSPNQLVSSGSHRKRGRPKKTKTMMQQVVDPNSISSSRKYALNGDDREDAQDALDVGSEKEVKYTSDLKEKARRQIKEVGHSSQTGGEEAFNEGDLPSEKGGDGSSCSIKKLLQKSSLEDIEKKAGNINSSEDPSKIFHSQKLKATKSPKSTHKRKRSGSAKKTYEVGELDERFVGKRIKVWWPLDKTYYEGVIESFNQTRKRHKVLYTDGEIENLNLYKQRWMLLEDDNLLDGERTNNQVVSPSPNRVPRKRRKSKFADESKIASSSKRAEVSASVTEIEASNPGDKTSFESSIDCPNIDGSAVGASRDVEKIEDDGANIRDVEKLDDSSVKSVECEKLKDDDANSGRAEKSQDDTRESAGGEKLEDDSIKSRRSEKLDDDGVQSGEVEKLKEDGKNSRRSEMLKDDGLDSVGGEKLKDGRVISKGGEKLKDDIVISEGVEKLKDYSIVSKQGEKFDDYTVESQECEKLKDDDVNSGRSEKSKHNDIESAGGEKLKDDSVESEGGEKVDDDGEKPGEAEKLNDSDAHSRRSEKLKDTESAGGEKLCDDSVNSGGGKTLNDYGVESEEAEKLKDDGVNYGGSEKLNDDGANSDRVKYGGSEKLKDDNANPGGCEKLENDEVKSVGGVKFKDDGVKPTTDKLVEEVLINSRDNLDAEELSISGEDECSSGVNLNQGKSSKSGDALTEEMLGKQTMPKTEMTSAVEIAGEYTQRDEEKLNEEKLGSSEQPNTASEFGDAEDVTGTEEKKLGSSKQTTSGSGTLS